MGELFILTEYCLSHNIDPAFVYSLQEEGLVTITTVEENTFIEDEELHRLEIYTRLHAQLGINTEGIDAITHLLEKLKYMQTEIRTLKEKLRLYEENE